MVVWSSLTLIFLVMLVVLLAFQDILGDGIKSTLGIMPKDPTRAAFVILDRAPVIVSLAVDHNHSLRFQSTSGWPYW